MSTAISIPLDDTQCAALPAGGEREHLMPITVRPQVAMVRGEGSYLFDENGRRYLDFIQGWAVNALGHCPSELVGALSDQAATLISPSPELHNLPQFELAARLCESSGLARAHFTNSGAEANEAAVKLARKWGQVHRNGAATIITTHSAFHGRTLAMMAASGKPGWDQLFPPAVQGFDKVPFGDLDAVSRAIDDGTVAVMIEPIQGEAGVVVPPPGYLRGLRALADEHGILLIADEVQTGIGRTGSLYACQREQVVPDIMTLGKGLGGGVPIAAMLATEQASCFTPGDQGGTYNGNPLMCAAALAVFDCVATPEFLAEVTARSAALDQGLRALAKRWGFLEVRGAGLLLAVRLRTANAAEVAARAFALGLLVNAPGPNLLRFMPSLRVSQDNIDACLNLLEDALAAAGERGAR